jgi:beta-phosphoglucomutase
MGRNVEIRYSHHLDKGIVYANMKISGGRSKPRPYGRGFLKRGNEYVTEIKAFIFDLDGVITDTAELHYLAWEQLTRVEGVPFTRDDNDNLRGLSRRDSLLRILNGRIIEEEQMMEWMERKNNFYLDLMDKLTPADVLPGTGELIKAAKASGIKIGLGSASRNARPVLDKLELTGSFDAIGDGYSVVNSKPAPDLFLWVAGRLDVNPLEAVIFEDAAAGIEAALAGGFWTVGVGTADVRRAHLTFPRMVDVTLEKVLQGLNATVGRTTPV